MNVIIFETLSLDQALEVLESQVAKLSRPAMAAFFAVIGEALLPLYIEFSHRHSWGDVAVLKEALTAALQYATGGADLRRTAQGMLESIARVIPDEQDFGAPESTFAMDAAICVDAAVRAGDPKQELNPAWVEYALEPATTMLCKQQTGYLDLGSSEKATAWRSQALRDPGLRGAFEALSEMIDFLAGRRAGVGPGELETLRRLATKVVVSPNP